MATAGSIVVDLLMRTGSFETDTDRASKKVKKLGKDSSDSAAQVGAAFGKIGGAVAGGLTVATVAVVNWTRQMVNASTELSKLSQLSGTSDQVFQRMAAGAATVGIQQDKLADIFKDTQDKLGDFYSTGGGAMKDFFDQIAPKVKLTAESFRNLSGPEVLQKYYKALEDAGASQADMVFYMEAIASDSAMLAPLLAKNGEGFRKWGDEAQRVGAILDGKTLAAMKEVKEQSNQMDLAFQGLKTQIATELLPQFRNMVDLLSDESTAKAFGSVAKGAAWLAGELANGTVQIVDFIKRVGDLRNIDAGGSVGAAGDRALNDRLGTLNDQIANAKSLMNAAPFEWTREQNRKLLEQYRKQRKEITDELARREKSREAEESFRGVTSSVNSTARIATPGSFRAVLEDKGAESAAKRLAEALKAANEQLDRQITLYGDASEMSKVAYEIQFGALQGIDKAAQTALLSNAALLDMLGNIDEANEILAEDAERFAAAFDSMFGLDDEAISAAAEVFSEWTAAADQAARNMQSTFADFLFDPFKDGLGGMVTGFGKAIQRMLAEAASAKIFEMIGGWATGYSGTGAGWINAIGGLLGGKRAGGGPVAAGGMYQVGEGNRPELLTSGNSTYLIPGDAGRVVPITSGIRHDGVAGPARLQAATITQQFHVNGNPDDRTMQMMKQAAMEGARMGHQMAAMDVASGRGPISESLGGKWTTNRKVG